MPRNEGKESQARPAEKIDRSETKISGPAAHLTQLESPIRPNPESKPSGGDKGDE